jgi:hypothetical protein
MNDKDHMQRLADALGTRRPRRDGYGDFVLEGRRGTIHADGKAWSLFVSFKTVRGLGHCKAAFAPFAELRQDADAEAVFHMPTLPTVGQAAIVRYFLGLPKRRILSDEQKAAQVARLRPFLFNKTASQSAKTGLKRAQTGFKVVI